MVLKPYLKSPTDKLEVTWSNYLLKRLHETGTTDRPKRHMIKTWSGIIAEHH